MQRAKSIDELYEEVKDYDMVLCNDAPLALALNNRVDKPLIGTFATTPRRIAQSISLDILGKSTLSEIETIRKVSDQTGYGLRFVHGEVENIRTMLRYKNDITPLLKKRPRRIYDAFIELPTLERVMREFDVTRSDFYKGKEVAVIGIELFDQLDKMMLPMDFDEISMFSEGEYTIPEIRELNNNRQIAENAVSLIDADNATDFAIVMDVGGSIADAVRSALYRKKVPFKNTLSVKDLNHIREFLEFVSLSLSFDTARISQIRELISSYGGRISPKYDEYLAEKFLDTGENVTGRTAEILDIMGDIRSFKYGELCDRVVPRIRAPQIKLLLDEMELTDNPVTPKDTEDLIYAVNNISDLKHNEQIPDSEKEGVVLIDCKNSVYIDRPAVIYLGMGQEWDRDLSFLNQIDYRIKPDENDRDLMKFQILLQQGTCRLYVCNATKAGRRPKPCSMFDQCTGSSVGDFKDVCGRIIRSPWKATEPPKDMRRGSDSLGTDTFDLAFSKTSYGNFVSCPRRFMYKILTGAPDNDRTVVGNILHEYAEMRICYPQIVKEYGREHYVEAVSEQCSGLFPPELRSLQNTVIRNCIANLDRFIETEELDVHGEPDAPLNRKKPNRFFEEAGKTLGCSNSEKSIRSSDGRMEGIFDLIDITDIIDFKTGKMHSPKDVSNMIDYDKDDYKDFQCLFYLSLMDELHPGQDLQFIQFYASANQEMINSGTSFDIRDNITRVRLIGSVDDFLRDEFRYMFKGNKYDPVQGIWPTIISDLISNDTADPGFIDSLTSLISSAASINRSSAKGIADQVIKNYNKVINGPLISGNTLFITKEGMSDFRKRFDADYERAKEMNRDGFPALPVIDCKKCEFTDICTAEVLTGGESDV